MVLGMTTASPRILIVEDNPDQRDLLRRNFERSACTVVLAESAEDAIVAFREASPDLAVIDLILPGMDGGTLITQLREERPGCAIVVTSVLDPVDFPDSDDVLPKPFTRADVERVLGNCLPNTRTGERDD
jgi:CheY-like chemotaxis protein